MFLDASVIIALLAGESEADDIRLALREASDAATSPLAVFEASSRLSRLLGVSIREAYDAISVFIDVMNVRMVDITVSIGAQAHDCADLYHHLTGHPARLNMGDCFAYAAARAAGLKLAYKGNDFVHTDIEGVRFGADAATAGT